MAFFRPFLDLTRQLWFALDTASALQHRGTPSAGARRHCMNEGATTAPVAV